MSGSTRQRNALTTLALALIAGAALTLPSTAAAATSCANVERGTHAPDTLVGTTAGDLLQAGGGSDESPQKCEEAEALSTGLQKLKDRFVDVHIDVLVLVHLLVIGTT